MADILSTLYNMVAALKEQYGQYEENRQDAGQLFRRTVNFVQALEAMDQYHLTTEAGLLPSLRECERAVAACQDYISDFHYKESRGRVSDTFCLFLCAKSQRSDYVRADKRLTDAMQGFEFARQTCQMTSHSIWTSKINVNAKPTYSNTENDHDKDVQQSIQNSIEPNTETTTINSYIDISQPNAPDPNVSCPDIGMGTSTSTATPGFTPAANLAFSSTRLPVRRAARDSEILARLMHSWHKELHCSECEIWVTLDDDPGTSSKLKMSNNASILFHHLSAGPHRLTFELRENSSGRTLLVHDISLTTKSSRKTEVAYGGFQWNAEQQCWYKDSKYDEGFIAQR